MGVKPNASNIRSSFFFSCMHDAIAQREEKRGDPTSDAFGFTFIAHDAFKLQKQFLHQWKEERRHFLHVKYQDTHLKA